MKKLMRKINIHSERLQDIEADLKCSYGGM